MTAPTESGIDIWDDDVLVDPYPTYAALREQAAVVHLPKNDLYVLTRYDVIRDALGDPETFSSTSIGFNPMVNEALQGTSLASDPPVHTQLRATLSQNLTPRALRGLKVVIDEKADKLVAELAASGSFEAIDSLARAFPIEIVADLIGFSGHVKDNMLRWGQAAMQVIGPLNQRTQESFPIAGELYGWCSSVTAEDLTPGSIGRGIFDAETRGDIPQGTAGHIIHQYLGAGVDTTIAVDRQHRRAVRPPPGAVRAGPQEPGPGPRRVRRGAALLGAGPHLGPQGNARRGDRAASRFPQVPRSASSSAPATATRGTTRIPTPST